jgi:hypothetical protein
MKPLGLGGCSLLLCVGLPAHAAAQPLRLVVSEQGPNQPWTVAIHNDGDKPMHLVADPRLLWFEVVAPGNKKTETCRLPGELFPSKPGKDFEVVLKPHDRVTSKFDPRYQCFAASGQSLLVPGAIVKPRFGWPEKTRTAWKKGKRVEVKVEQSPPYVARTEGEPSSSKQDKDEGRGEPSSSKQDKVDARGEPVKLLRAEPWALKSSYAAWSRSGLSPEKATEAPLELKLSQGSDSDVELSAEVTFTLRNRSRETQRVFIRREFVTFEVMSQDTMATCDAKPDLRAPDPQEFVTLRPGGSFSLPNRLVELCPRGTFARPGLYLVQGRFDSAESGEEFDVNAYVGRVVTSRPVTIRIRKGDEKPRLVTMRLVRDAKAKDK